MSGGSPYSGKTNHYWGIVRPDGKAVMSNPLSRYNNWHIDDSLLFAGFPVDSDDPESWEAGNARRGAQCLTDDLIERGVAPEAAEHHAALFTVVTSVQVSR
jgi:hypothetical protein